MRDLLNILSTHAALPPDEPSLLGTVVRVDGSSYRLPGARMLIDASGKRTGSVSGGCLEADLARRGRLLSDDQPHTLVRYDGTDEDASWNFGLGCNGSIEIFLERLTPTSDAGLGFLRDCIQHHASAAILTVFASDNDPTLLPGLRLLLTGQSEFNPIARHPLSPQLLADAHHSLNTGQTTTVTYETPNGSVHALVEYIAPPLPLVIFGAGHDALPLVRYAKSLGWHVTVCDRRPGYARPDHFPQADAVVTAADRIPLSHHTIAVIMTHHYPDDLDLLKTLLPSAARYIGLLGPRARAQRLLNELAEENFSPTPAQLARLHAPIGIDIGAEGPEQVALSVISEILAVLNDRTGGFLRGRNSPIHPPSNTRIVIAQPTLPLPA